jgi:hypothetical protein
MQFVTVEVTGVESPTKGGTTFGVVAVCANTTSCALEQTTAAATRIATVKRRTISSAGSEKFRQHHSGTAFADKNRQALAFVYCEDELGRRRGQLSPSCRSCCASRSADAVVGAGDAGEGDYRSGFGFHSRASFCASAICTGVMRSAMLSLYFIAKLLPRAADKLSHLCART